MVTTPIASPATSSSDDTHTPRTIGVEEEFHLVDRTTRRLAPKAPQLLELLEGKKSYVAEMQRCVIEVNSDVVTDLDDLQKELTRHRHYLSERAAELDLAIVAAGTVPLAVPAELPLTETHRFRRMLADYQLLAREQLICGTQVHIAVEDRDDAVAIAERVAPDLPTLLALSASSPFWADGTDTGYASARALIWSRWPTTGLSSGTQNAAELDALVDQLIQTGVITDPGMMYFDTRASAHLPTLELRICDSCPSTDTICLVAGIFRAMVDREYEAHKAGEPCFKLPATVGRAATWRAARSGLEGDLVDIRRGVAAPAGEVLHNLVDSLEPWLRRNGDWETVNSLLESALLLGSSALRQRRAMRLHGRLTDVVDLLAAETAHAMFPPAPDNSAGLLSGYVDVASDEELTEVMAPKDASYDEALNADAEPRAAYTTMLQQIQELGVSGLRQREDAIYQLARADGVTFKVTGEKEPQVFPLDPIPRIVTAQDWAHLSKGAEQRAKALDAFLRDVYDDSQIVSDGIVPQEILDRAPGYRSVGRQIRRGVRAHISGLDIVTDGPGRWCVLEDNLRVPSGVGYAMSNRYLTHKLLPELSADNLLDTRKIPELLAETLTLAAPNGGCERDEMVIISSGPEDSAWPEHQGLARGMKVAVITPSDVNFENGQMVHSVGGKSRPIRVAYLRIDEDMLLSSPDASGQPLRFGLVEALHRKNLTLANALGNGVGDDKAVYSFVPKMIEYYLGEKPILDSVPTYLCADREECDYVLKHLDSLVTKPIDGYGGIGVLIGPDASDEDIAARRREIEANPERYIAQKVVSLSTCPTFDGNTLRPHHVDLRMFVHLRESEGNVSALTMPAALTRVGAAGNKIVNSSSGGGSKDTWILSK